MRISEDLKSQSGNDNLNELVTVTDTSELDSFSHHSDRFEYVVASLDDRMEAKMQDLFQSLSLSFSSQFAVIMSQINEFLFQLPVMSLSTALGGERQIPQLRHSAWAQPLEEIRLSGGMAVYPKPYLFG